MAKQVTAQVTGGAPKLLDNVRTVGDVKQQMNVTTGYSASVNGDPEDDTYELSDYENVSLAPSVKGGNF